MTSRSSLLALLLLGCLLGGCAFHTTADAWHGRLGPDGEPVFFTATKKVGLKLFFVVPCLGNTEIDGMVNDLTENIARRGGDRVRLLTGEAENYWYGLPPLTWIFTPVIGTVSAEYRPSPEEFLERAEIWAGPSLLDEPAVDDERDDDKFDEGEP